MHMSPIKQWGRRPGFGWVSDASDSPQNLGYRKGERDGPAPVVPPERFDIRMVGDWSMDKSLPAIVSSRTFAFGLRIPSAWDGNV